MLKRLELVGFKSFADKTQFDFGPGITAVVGPNGSGKSNVVDAVRWILGEQSAKSLRGGEMADVIFNGSSSRKSLGLAEVTLTLDNSRRHLTIDADDVQVTRRVYRDGEGEYLINHQPARLKDIKEMFLGSGAGADAYCIIEQGRVDVLLQASTKERRLIFEEAAGISRFKAKKIETLRKLERVEQNLLRLRDIIEEVDRQLRSVKLQAAKAQRYKEHTERLKELRVTLSLDEYHLLYRQLQQVGAALDQLRAAVADHARKVAHKDAEIQRLEQVLTELDNTLRREGESTTGVTPVPLAAARECIVTAETTLHHERTLSESLEQDQAQTRVQLQQLTGQLASMAGAVEASARELAEVDRQCAQETAAAEKQDNELANLVSRLTDHRDRIQSNKVELMEQMRQAARLHNELVSLKAQTDSLVQHRQRLLQKTSHATQNLSLLDEEVRGLVEAEMRLQGQLDAARQELAEVRRQRDDIQQAADLTSQQLSYSREQRSGLASRIQVLERLEESYEGLSAGVQEVLALLRQADPGPWQTVLGLVADLLEVPHEHAALIDLALGERAHCLVVQDSELLASALAQHGRPFSGRVSFLPLAKNSEKDAATRPNRLLESSLPARVRLPMTPDGIPAHPGVVALASRLVRCDHRGCADLPEQLLGTTLIVKDLATAREIANLTSGFRFVTLQGELLEINGVLTVGAHGAGSSVLSRKSELRELRSQAVVLDEQIAGIERKLAELREQLAKAEAREETVQQQIQVLGEQAADLRSRLTQQRQRHEGLAEELHVSQIEIRQMDEELQTLAQALQTAETEAKSADGRVQEIQTQLETLETDIRGLEQERQQAQQACTAAKVALATAQERRTGLANRHQRIQQDWEQRQADLRRQQDHLANIEDRTRESQATMLRASSALAQAHVDKEKAEQRIHSLNQDCERLRAERQQHVEEAQKNRQEWQELQEQMHARELETSDLQHQLDGLAVRMREDHKLDLAGLYDACMTAAKDAGDADPRPISPPPDHVAVQEEIAELKRKITRLGSVSLDSLQELEDLETRSKTLQAQHDDLASAKQSLDAIIHKINQDSRKLFTDTFATIRGHFHELFRKLFGGGMADIILEDENDVLESGIEIIARPPGKELRSISLLSGGEKTLTAVALLLAIFRSKPSPFCILDEVDAALDEANIGRYTAVLREFLDRSQFIIVTHSKKTMAEADVLYGVTMQESGISKRVVVRLEDWADEDAEGSKGEEAVQLPAAPDGEQAESAA